MPRSLTVLLVLVAALAAPAGAQTFEVIPDSVRVTVGDPMWARLLVRLGEGDQILDSIPVPHEGLRRGVRILATEGLSRTAHRRYEGRIRLAFYRTGSQPVPTLELPFRRGAVVLSAMMLSEAATVEVTPVLPAGSPSLKDLKDLEPVQGWGPLPWIVALAVAATGVLLVARRRRRPRPPPMPAPEPQLLPPPSIQTPYEAALAQLALVERENWPGRGDMARHYEAIVDVLRDYLVEGERVAARERTTTELLRLLSPQLVRGDLRARCRDILSDADLVKFAKWVPSRGEAAAFLDDARAILERWQGAKQCAENGKGLLSAAGASDRTANDAVR